METINTNIPDISYLLLNFKSRWIKEIKIKWQEKPFTLNPTSCRLHVSSIDRKLKKN